MKMEWGTIRFPWAWRIQTFCSSPLPGLYILACKSQNHPLISTTIKNIYIHGVKIQKISVTLCHTVGARTQMMSHKWVDRNSLSPMSAYPCCTGFKYAALLHRKQWFYSYVFKRVTSDKSRWWLSPNDEVIMCFGKLRNRKILWTAFLGIMKVKIKICLLSTHYVICSRKSAGVNN